MKTHHLAAILILLTNAIASAEPRGTNGLLLNFHDVPLQTVLNYLSDKADLIVVSEANVRGTVTVTARQPLSTADEIGLLNDELSRNNYTAILDGRTLTIMDSSAAKTNALTPVLTATDPAQVPSGNRIVTEILPVHTLNPVQLLKDLEPLIPSGDTVMANESGNAVIMTASQSDIHRIAEIITALDSTAVSEVNVFELNYADAQSVAAELKELFQSGDSDANRAGARMTFGPRFGRFNNPGTGDTTEKTTPTRAVFVADGQMNAVAASAPPGYMPLITRVVSLLDKPGQEVTDVEVFPLLHADPAQVVDEITSLFASAEGTKSAEQPTRPMGFLFGSPAPKTTTESSRLKQQSTVTAVADPRTQSVLVLAGVNMMGQIKQLITRLDNGERGVIKVTFIPLGEGDPDTTLDVVTTLWPSMVPESRSQAPVNSALAARISAGINSQSSSASTSSIFGSSSSGPQLH